MANPHRGQVPLVAGEATYTLSMSINAMCALEDHLGRPIGEIMLEMYAVQANPARLSVKLPRAVLWAALQDHHSEIDEAGAGEVMDHVGVVPALAAVTKAMSLAFPAKEKGKGEGVPQSRPPKAAG